MDEEGPAVENVLARIEKGGGPSTTRLERNVGAEIDVDEAKDRRLGIEFLVYARHDGKAARRAERSGAAFDGGVLKGRSPRHGTRQALQNTLLISCNWRSGVQLQQGEYAVGDGERIEAGAKDGEDVFLRAAY